MLNKSTISRYKKGLSAMVDGNETFLAEFDKLIESYNKNMENQGYSLAFRNWYNNAGAALAGGYLCTPAFHFATVIIVHLMPAGAIEPAMLSLANESAKVLGSSINEIVKTVNNSAEAVRKPRYTRAEPTVVATSGCGGGSVSFRSGC